MKTGSTEELTVDAFLQRFLPFARRRIETAQAQDGQYLRPSDPAYEQVLDSLATVARHTPVPLLEALLRWRESESPKGANDASTFQRKLAVECIFCSACIRIVECCPQEGLTEKVWAGFESFVFDWTINADRVVSQVEYPSLVDLRGLLLDLVAQLLGVLSRIRFRSVTKRFFLELDARRIDTSVARSETLFIINGMRYLKLGVKTEGGLDASASFVTKANPLNRAPHKRKSELYHALCNMLSNILAPLADGGKSQWPPAGVDRALALWYEAIGQMRGQLMNWMDKQSRHIAVGYPLVTLLLCFGDPQIFNDNLTPHMEQLYKLLRGKNHRFMALDCLHRVLRFYLSVHAANQPKKRIWYYLDSVTCELLTALRKGMLTQDVQHDKLVEFCVTIAEYNVDYAINHMILELLKQDSLGEAKVIGLRAWHVIGMLPSSQHVGLEIFKGHDIKHYIPKVNAAIESISSTTIGHQGITLPEIQSACGNFGRAYLIAEGGSAKVYKGKLRGKLVAIKKLKPESDETEPMETKYFAIEVAALGICEHPNIVKMIGYYMDEKERIIVSEYVARGSLYSLLHARSRDDPIIDWNTRLRIALDIASGMTYLHDNKNIIHRDLKAQNILLDEHLRAKVADLGIVKSRAYNDGEVYTKLIGTRGYLCPHYVATGSLGTYSDVYAFGVILLELISGRKALDNFTLLADSARTIMQNGSHLRLFDRHLVGKIEESVLNNVAMLATKCVALRKEDRPTMGQIHSELLSMTQM